MKRLLPAVCAALLSVPSSAQVWRSYIRVPARVRMAEACPKISPVVIGGLQGYADGMSSGLCFVSIDPTDTPNLIYRSYGIFSDGLFMVFNSYGDGDNNPNLTSAREFFFFPRRGVPELTMDAKSGTVSVRMADGGRADFNPVAAQVSGFERGSAVVTPKVDPANRGGVEIPSYAGLMLDAGFRIGESPSGRPNAESTFRDAAGKTCTLKNSELFTYANGDHAFKFTDAQLSAWLKTACPGLNAGF
jgi:hypothetical protein